MKKFLSLLLLCTVVFFTLLPAAVYAAGVTVSMKVTSGTVYPGCTMTVVVAATGNDVMIMQGKPIEYNQKLLEMRGQPQSGLDSWVYDEKSNFIVNHPSYTTVSGTDLPMLKYTFKVNESVSIGTKITLKIKDLVVSTADGVQEHGYTGSAECVIEVKERPKSSNANLSSLSLDAATLLPSFSSSVTEYTATVPHTVTSLSVNASTSSDAARYTVSGNKDLKYGTNEIKVEVVAENGGSKTYVITVTRTQPPSKDTGLASLTAVGFDLSPAFDTQSFDYAVTVLPETETLAIEAAAHDEKASVRVIGNEGLEIGENTVTVSVTAEDGVSMAVYILHVTRPRPIDTDSTLSVLSFGEYVLDPLFDPASETREYRVDVPYEIDSISPLEVVCASANATCELDAPEKFEVGENIVTVVCKAEDAEHISTYTLTVVRSPRILNSDSKIKSLVYDQGSLTPKFSPDIYTYFILTDPNPGVLTFNAVPNDPAASAETVAFCPSSGLNEQTVTCRAEDGSVSVYTIYVFTPPVNDPHLYLRGSAVVGTVLIAEIEDVGDGGAYAWYVNGELVEGQTKSSYTVREEDGGKTVYAVYTDKDGNEIRSQTLSVPMQEQPTPEPTSPSQPEPEPKNDNKMTDLAVVLVLSVFCLGAGILIGIFFTKKKRRNKEQ